MGGNIITASVCIVSLSVVFTIGCSSSTTLFDRDVYDQYAYESYERQVSANGKPFGNVHQLHSGLAGCLDCHAAHGMSFGWQTPDRTYCLGCHTDKTNHHRSQDCLQCHNTSGGPGGS